MENRFLFSKKYNRIKRASFHHLSSIRIQRRCFLLIPALFVYSCHHRRGGMVVASFSTESTPLRSLSTIEPYTPPSWTQGHLTKPPTTGRLRLAHVPTPIYPLLSLPPEPTELLANLGVTLYIKRDDMTGSVETGGNKIRKLEFLLADALQQGCDAVVTIGGAQSNHCRATAAACRMLSGTLEPHLILRTRQPDDDVGMVGNLLFDRAVGSTIYTCTPGEYGRLGSQALVKRVCDHLRRKEERRPYAIPVGGSNGLGTWGYIEAVDELMQQLNGNLKVNHVVFACGSGGTAAGIALGMALYNQSEKEAEGPKVHAMGVCDDPDYFYRYVASIADEMGLQQADCDSTEDFVRKHMIVHQSKGRGYALSTAEELQEISSFARATGVVLDPVYSGKALHNFFQVIRQDPESYRNSNILFWHTGGALGLYDKCPELDFTKSSPCHRLDVYGNSKIEGCIDISK